MSPPQWHGLQVKGNGRSGADGHGTTFNYFCWTADIHHRAPNSGARAWKFQVTRFPRLPTSVLVILQKRNCCVKAAHLHTDQSSQSWPEPCPWCPSLLTSLQHPPLSALFQRPDHSTCPSHSHLPVSPCLLCVIHPGHLSDGLWQLGIGTDSVPCMCARYRLRFHKDSVSFWPLSGLCYSLFVPEDRSCLCQC